MYFPKVIYALSLLIFFIKKPSHYLRTESCSLMKATLILPDIYHVALRLLLERAVNVIGLSH